MPRFVAIQTKQNKTIYAILNVGRGRTAFDTCRTTPLLVFSGYF
jgi:hypothetical protein